MAARVSLTATINLLVEFPRFSGVRDKLILFNKRKILKK